MANSAAQKSVSPAVAAIVIIVVIAAIVGIGMYLSSPKKQAGNVEQMKMKMKMNMKMKGMKGGIPAPPAAPGTTAPGAQ